MPPVQLPAPYLGQNDQIPLAELTSPYAERVKNFNLDDGLARLRKGESVWSSVGNSAIRLLSNLFTYGSGSTQKMFVTYDQYPTGTGIEILDVSTLGLQTSVFSAAGGGSDKEIATLHFNKYLFVFGEVSLRPAGADTLQYDGTTWGYATYTYPTMTYPFGGASYKNRAYIIERNSSKFAYSGINAISGATTEVDLAQVTTSRAQLYGIRSVSLSDGIQQENVLCFIFDSGEILVYSGSYPNASDWSLVARFNIPAPVYYSAFVDVNGDSFVITKSSLISLRSLFSQGDNIAATQALSAPIATRWKQCLGFDWTTGLGINMYVKGVFDYINQRIIISLPNYIDWSGARDTTKGMRLIYSLKTRSWTEHVISLTSGTFLGTPAIFKDNLYQLQFFAVMKAEGSTGYVDAQADNSTSTGYEYEIRSAPITNGKAFVQASGGLEPFIESDLYTETEYRLIADLGAQTTDAQKIPSRTSTLDKTLVNLGIEGSYIQYKISGTTVAGKTIGYKLFGINFHQQSGTETR